MNHATTAQPTPTGMMSAAEGAELRRQIADLTRRLEEALRELAAVKAGKMDTQWGVKVGGGLFVFTFGLLLLLLVDGRERLVRLEEGQAAIKALLEKETSQVVSESPSELGDIFAQPAIYYPSAP